MSKKYFIISGILALFCVVCLVVAAVSTRDLDYFKTMNEERTFRESELHSEIRELEEELSRTFYYDTSTRENLEKRIKLNEAILDGEQKLYGSGAFWYKKYNDLVVRCTIMGILSAGFGFVAIMMFEKGKGK